MPALFYLSAACLAVVVTTGAVLDKMNVRPSWRVNVWVGLVLLPFLLLFLFLLLLGPFKWPC
jgi:hypothetical protein